MKIITVFTCIMLASCTTFSKYSKYNVGSNCDASKYYCIKNDSLNLNYKTFGGFKIANNLQEYRKLKGKNAPHFKDIIFYAKSDILKGGYYLLLDNNKKRNGFKYKDTVINSKKITIAMDNALDYNSKFILNFSTDK